MRDPAGRAGPVKVKYTRVMSGVGKFISGRNITAGGKMRQGGLARERIEGGGGLRWMGGNGYAEGGSNI